MITIFNRKELFITFSMKAQADTRAALKKNNIKYYLKTINMNSPSAIGGTRGRGTFGQNLDMSYEYIFYVHKNDLERAKGSIRR